MPKFRNVVAKEAVRPLDSTLMEVDFVNTSALAHCVILGAIITLAQVEGNKENQAAPACPLPANTYTSAHLFQETRHAPAPGWHRML